MIYFAVYFVELNISMNYGDWNCFIFTYETTTMAPFIMMEAKIMV